MKRAVRPFTRGVTHAACLACASVLAGCVSLSGLGGSSKYACKAPEGSSCNSVSGTYANTVDDAQERAPKAADALAALSAPRVTRPNVESPLRSKPRVLRLWIKPWEDSEGDLVDETRVYVQIDRGEWLIDHLPRVRASSQVPLLRPPVSSATPAPAGPAASLSSPR